MSFQIREHIISCHHEPQTNKSQENLKPKRLLVKQYTPLRNPSPNPGDVTIIGGHANGFPKEVYEPLWEDLDRSMLKNGRTIRSIWIADVSYQGASGLLNEEYKYENVTWYDHVRDLLQMLNHFRAEMSQPVCGLGHSMGANQLLMLSLAQPGLFTTLIIMDPIINPGALYSSGNLFAKATLHRRVEWPSRVAAEASFKKRFANWDSRVIEQFNKFALYPYPTLENRDSPARLVTGRYQELMGFLRPTFIYEGGAKGEDVHFIQESLTAHRLIDWVSCNVLYICGGTSLLAGSDIRKDLLGRTGIQSDRWTGMCKRRIEESVVPNAGHFVPMEAPKACAEAAAKWLDEEISKWHEEEERLQASWGGLSIAEKERKAEEWIKNLKAKL